MMELLSFITSFVTSCLVLIRFFSLCLSEPNNNKSCPTYLIAFFIAGREQKTSDNVQKCFAIVDRERSGSQCSNKVCSRKKRLFYVQKETHDRCHTFFLCFFFIFLVCVRLDMARHQFTKRVLKAIEKRSSFSWSITRTSILPTS